MKERWKLKKEFHNEFGNYEGFGKYSDYYIEWLENKIIEHRDKLKSCNCMSCELELKKRDNE